MTELAHRRPQSVAEHAQVDYSKALQYLGLTPGQPAAQALILVCKRYELDPLLGHVSLYDGKPYVHFAGYLHIANAHPEFAGVECVKEWDDDTYCWATVRVHRADRDFPAERTGKSRKQKRKKDGSTYTDDDADAKAFAQACRRALRMSFNIDHPDPAEDDTGPVAAPAPVVEVARRVASEQMDESSRQPSDPGATPPDAPGSDITSEAEVPPRVSRGSRRDSGAAPAGRGASDTSASDLNASVTGPGDTDASAGQEPPNAEASTSRRRPSSPGGRRDRQSRSEVPGGASAGTNSGETTASGEGPPTGPQRTSERGAANDATSNVKQAGSADPTEGNREGADPSLLPEPPGWER